MHRRRGGVTDGAGSSIAAEWSDRARAVALQPLSGWCGCVYKPGWLWPLQMAKRVSKRATRGGERQSTEAPGHCIHAPRPERSVRSVWTRRACFPGACGPGGSSSRDSAPRWPAGSPAQWQRPRMWTCVGPRDPPTKLSRGWLRVVVRKPRLVLLEFRATRNKVTAKPRSYCRGCAPRRGVVHRGAATCGGPVFAISVRAACSSIRYSSSAVLPCCGDSHRAIGERIPLSHLISALTSLLILRF